MTSEALVGLTWLSGILGENVGLTYPDLKSDEGRSLVQQGWTTISKIDDRTTIRGKYRPIFEVICWAAPDGSDELPWGRAEELAQTVERAIENRKPLSRNRMLVTDPTTGAVSRVIVNTPGFDKRQRPMANALLLASHFLTVLLPWSEDGTQGPLQQQP